MLERYTVIGVTFSIAMIILDFYLLKKRKIQGRGFVFWFIMGAVIGLLSTVPPLLSFISVIFGTEFSISAFMTAGFLFFLLAIFYLHYRISELHSMLVKLAMEVSVVKHSQKRSKRGNPERRKDNEVN